MRTKKKQLVSHSRGTHPNSDRRTKKKVIKRRKRKTIEKKVRHKKKKRTTQKKRNVKHASNGNKLTISKQRRGGAAAEPIALEIDNYYLVKASANYKIVTERDGDNGKINVEAGKPFIVKILQTDDVNVYVGTRDSPTLLKIPVGERNDVFKKIGKAPVGIAFFRDLSANIADFNNLPLVTVWGQSSVMTNGTVDMVIFKNPTQFAKSADIRVDVDKIDTIYTFTDSVVYKCKGNNVKVYSDKYKTRELDDLVKNAIVKTEATDDVNILKIVDVYSNVADKGGVDKKVTLNSFVVISENFIKVTYKDLAKIIKVDGKGATDKTAAPAEGADAAAAAKAVADVAAKGEGAVEAAAATTAATTAKAVGDETAAQTAAAKEIQSQYRRRRRRNTAAATEIQSRWRQRKLQAESASVLVVDFVKPDSLGLKLNPNAEGQVEVVRVNPGTQAESHPQLKAGLFIKAVGDKGVGSFADYPEFLAFLKTQDRPLQITFDTDASVAARFGDTAVGQDTVDGDGDGLTAGEETKTKAEGDEGADAEGVDAEGAAADKTGADKPEEPPSELIKKMEGFRNKSNGVYLKSSDETIFYYKYVGVGKVPGLHIVTPTKIELFSSFSDPCIAGPSEVVGGVEMHDPSFAFNSGEEADKYQDASVKNLNAGSKILYNIPFTHIQNFLKDINDVTAPKSASTTVEPRTYVVKLGKYYDHSETELSSGNEAAPRLEFEFKVQEGGRGEIQSIYDKLDPLLENIWPNKSEAAPKPVDQNNHHYDISSIMAPNKARVLITLRPDIVEINEKLKELGVGQDGKIYITVNIKYNGPITPSGAALSVDESDDGSVLSEGTQSYVPPTKSVISVDESDTASVLSGDSHSYVPSTKSVISASSSDASSFDLDEDLESVSSGSTDAEDELEEVEATSLIKYKLFFERSKLFIIDFYEQFMSKPEHFNLWVNVLTGLSALSPYENVKQLIRDLLIEPNLVKEVLSEGVYVSLLRDPAMKTKINEEIKKWQGTQTKEDNDGAIQSYNDFKKPSFVTDTPTTQDTALITSVKAKRANQVISGGANPIEAKLQERIRAAPTWTKKSIEEIKYFLKNRSLVIPKLMKFYTMKENIDRFHSNLQRIEDAVPEVFGGNKISVKLAEYNGQKLAGFEIDGIGFYDIYYNHLFPDEITKQEKVRAAIEDKTAKLMTVDLLKKSLKAAKLDPGKVRDSGKTDAKIAKNVVNTNKRLQSAIAAAKHAGKAVEALKGSLKFKIKDTSLKNQIYILNDVNIYNLNFATYGDLILDDGKLVGSYPNIDVDVINIIASSISKGAIYYKLFEELGKYVRLFHNLVNDAVLESLVNTANGALVAEENTGSWSASSRPAGELNTFLKQLKKFTTDALKSSSSPNVSRWMGSGAIAGINYINEFQGINDGKIKQGARRSTVSTEIPDDHWSKRKVFRRSETVGSYVSRQSSCSQLIEAEDVSISKLRGYIENLPSFKELLDTVKTDGAAPGALTKLGQVLSQ